jgi:uncharacterized membrane protein
MEEKELGPVSYLAFEFEGTKFDGSMLPDLMDLVNRKLIVVHDLVIVMKDDQGRVVSRELLDFQPDEIVMINPLKSQIRGLFTTGDIAAIGEMIRPNTTAALLLIEHLWSAKFFHDVAANKGRVVGNEFVPPALVMEALEDAEATAGM